MADPLNLRTLLQPNTNTPRVRRTSSHRSPHAHSGSGSGLWLAGSPSPKEEMQAEASQKRYHFPAELTRGSTLGLDFTKLAAMKESGSEDVDLDLSFDFISTYEKSKAQSQPAPSPNKVRGMASADWEKRRKLPPAPLALQQQQQRVALKPVNRHLALLPLPDELVGRSAFSPVTPFPAGDNEPLPITPLSSTRRGQQSYQTKPDSPDHYKTAPMYDKENVQEKPRSVSLCRPGHSASCSFSSQKKAVSHRFRSSIGSTGLAGPPPFPPPIGPLPSPKEPLCNAASSSSPSIPTIRRSQSQGNTTIRSSSIGSFLTADAGSSHGHEQLHEVVQANAPATTSQHSLSIPASSTPMLLSASGMSAATASNSDRSSPRSHASLITPFSPLFSDPGAFKTNMTSSSEWVGDWNPTQQIGFGAGALKLSNMDIVEPPKNQAIPVLKERRQTEQWIMAQRERRPDFQRLEMDGQDGRVYSIRAQPRDSRVEHVDFAMAEGSSSSEDGDHANETLVISTSTSSGKEAISMFAPPKGQDMARHDSSMPPLSAAKAPIMNRNRSGTTGPWPQSPLLLSPAEGHLALPQEEATYPVPPSPAGTTIIKDLPDDDLLEDKADTQAVLFKLGDHCSTKASSDSAPSLMMPSSSIGLGLGLGLGIGPSSLPRGSIGSLKDGHGAVEMKKVRSEGVLRTTYLLDASSPALSPIDDPLGSPHFVIDMNAETGKAQEVPLARGSALGLDLGINGASPALPDDFRSPRTFSGKQFGSNGPGGIESMLRQDVIVHRAVANLSGAPTHPTMKESRSFASSISAFAYNETPPVSLQEGMGQREPRKSGLDNLWRLSRIADCNAADLVDLDMEEPHQAVVAGHMAAQGESRNRWKFKLWNMVAPQEERKHVPSIKPFMLANKRQSLVLDKAEVDARMVAERLVGSSSIESLAAESLAQWRSEQGSISTPATALLPQDKASFEAPAKVAIKPLPSPDLGRSLVQDLQRSDMPNSTSSSSKHMSMTERRAKRNSGIGYISSNKQSRRSSGIAYITDDGEMSFGNQPAEVKRKSMQLHARRVSATSFGGKERSAPEVGIFDGIKSPRAAPSPSGFTPRMRFEPNDWGVAADQRQQHQPYPHAQPPQPTTQREEPTEDPQAAMHDSMTFEEMQESRDRLRLLASQAMLGATLPHQYLEQMAIKRKSGTSTRPAHHRPTHSVQETEATAAHSHLHNDGLHRQTRTARFADDMLPEEDAKSEEPETAGRRPVSIFVPTTSIQAHLLRRAGVQTESDARLRSRRHSISALASRPFGTPASMLDSATPSKSMFWAGFLGMPWLWLIGGWWLGEDGLVIRPSNANKIEFWQHEPSMSAQASPELRQGEFPSTADMSKRGTLKSRQTLNSLGGGAAPSVSSSAVSGNTTTLNPSKIPRSRTKRLMSWLDPQPKVALYHSPVRVVKNHSLMDPVPEEEDPSRVEEAQTADPPPEPKQYMDETFQHLFTRQLSRHQTAFRMKTWGHLERYVLLNRVAAIFGSLLVMAGWSTAIWEVVTNF